MSLVQLIVRKVIAHKDELLGGHGHYGPIAVQHEITNHGQIAVSQCSGGESVVFGPAVFDEIGSRNGAEHIVKRQRRKLRALGHKLSEPAHLPLGKDLLIGGGIRGDFLQQGGVNASGHIGALGVIDPAGALRVADSKIALVPVRRHIGEAAAVGRLQNLLNISEFASCKLPLLILGHALGIDHAGEHGGELLQKKLRVALDAGAHQAVCDKGGKAVAHGVFKGLGGIGNARHKANLRHSGILAEEAAWIFGAEVLAVGIGSELNAGNFTLGVHGHRQLNRLSRIALGGGKAQGIAQAGSLGVDALNGLRYLSQRGAAGVHIVERFKALCLRHDAEQGGQFLSGAIALDNGSGKHIDSGKDQRKHRENQNQRQGRLKIIFFHLQLPPSGFFAVHFSRKGVTRFMARIEKDTPSG